MFAPSTIVTVTVEDGQSDDEVHFHAGGQGFWIARLLGRLGVPTTLCTVLGGESGRVAGVLLDVEPVTVRAVGSSDPNGAWIHDRRSGERRSLAEAPGRALSRHDADELFGATLAAALSDGICVLAGPHRPNLIDSDQYRRLAADLRANDVVVVADLSGAHLEAALRGGLDFCKVSSEDLRASGWPSSEHPVSVVGQLRASGADNAVVTCGEDPLVAAIGDQRIEVRGPRLSAVDHRGAGDAFTALIAAARHWGLDWLDAIRWGVAAGALTVVRRGLATADRREIHQLLDRIEVHPIEPN